MMLYSSVQTKSTIEADIAGQKIKSTGWTTYLIIIAAFVVAMFYVYLRYGHQRVKTYVAKRKSRKKK